MLSVYPGGQDKSGGIVLTALATVPRRWSLSRLHETYPRHECVNPRGDCREGDARGSDELAARLYRRGNSPAAIREQPHEPGGRGREAAEPAAHRLDGRESAVTPAHPSLAGVLHAWPVEVQMPREEAGQRLPARAAVRMHAAVARDRDHRWSIRELAQPLAVIVCVHDRMTARRAPLWAVAVGRAHAGHMGREVLDIGGDEGAAFLAGRIGAKEARCLWRRG